ncbi:stage II sporulation protein M [Caldalkalibacillus salinus]|uniref:stage II sporulation protein M n=1 Tax=Caldalkalibacillus salinus TaxID=2803787 RepID=UPI001923C6F3|nr:stage II sporulation protein M [Caldalkalibacillus salinus]
MLQALKKLMSESQSYIIFSGFLMLLGTCAGYTYPHVFEEAIAQVLEQLEEVSEIIGDNDDPLYTSWIIFTNNVTAALVMMLAGTALFFIPLSSLFVNGVAVGYILGLTAEEGVSPLTLFLYGILPHGVLELPAIIIAGGVGLFFGLRVLGWLFGQGQFLSHLFSSERGDVRTFWREQTLPVLIDRAKGALFLILILILVLLVAGLIEGFITPGLLEPHMPSEN